MKIALVTEAWPPQVNGVATTWTHVKAELEQRGHDVLVLHSGLFWTLPMPRYPDVRLAPCPVRTVTRALDHYQPNAIHLATEGPLGMAARRYCAKHRLAFTTSYHTQFPDYLCKYLGVPRNVTYRYMRWFHSGARATLVPTLSVKKQLDRRGFTNVVVWTRGVDHTLFRPTGKAFLSYPRPIFLYAGRLAHEKNIPAFLNLQLPGSKLVIGPGPLQGRLAQRYPGVHFTGYLPPKQFAQHMAAADVLVFPSRTDTFGLVMIEALACGVPVAAYPVTGPVDIHIPNVTAVMNENLLAAAMNALSLEAAACRQHALTYRWSNCAQMVLQHLAPIG